jgi:transcriptional regulator with XRE-family HTH domain
MVYGVEMINFGLLRAIKESGFTQRDFSALVGDHESVVSRIVNGIWIPDPVRKIRYAKILRKKVEDLFDGKAEG